MMLTDASFVLEDWREADQDEFERFAAQWRFEGWQYTNPRPNTISYKMPVPAAVLQDDHNRVAFTDRRGKTMFHRVRPSIMGVSQCGQVSFRFDVLPTSAEKDTPACQACDR